MIAAETGLQRSVTCTVVWQEASLYFGDRRVSNDFVGIFIPDFCLSLCWQQTGERGASEELTVGSVLEIEAKHSSSGMEGERMGDQHRKQRNKYVKEGKCIRCRC